MGLYEKKKSSTVRVESRTSDVKVNVSSIAPRQLILISVVKLIIFNTFAH